MKILSQCTIVPARCDSDFMDDQTDYFLQILVRSAGKMLLNNEPYGTFITDLHGLGTSVGLLSDSIRI